MKAYLIFLLHIWLASSVLAAPDIVGPVTPEQGGMTPDVVGPVDPKKGGMTPDAIAPVAPGGMTPDSIAPVAPSGMTPDAIAPVAPGGMTPDAIAPVAPGGMTPDVADPAAPIQGGMTDGGSDYTRPEIETPFLGSWIIENPNAGVAAMQLQLMPNDQVVWFDTTSLGPSALKLPDDVPCPINPEAKNMPDCFVHAIAYDWKTTKFRPLTLKGDAWCSSGNMWPNGNLMATGGTFTGDKAIRVLANDDLKADFDTRIGVLACVRWYSSNQVLPDGSVAVVGGRDSYNYEIVPPQMEFKQQKFDLPFLHHTTAPPLGPGRYVENNLYPFVYLLPDGNLFIFANNRAISLTPQTGMIVREYPELMGGSRNYPPSGMSALLPLKLTPENQPLNTEIVICGGNLPNAYEVVDAKHVNEKVFMPALQDCHRIKPLDKDANWIEEERMPSPRTMGDLLHLANGDLLMLNGAKAGTSGWENARDANLVPLLYTPNKPMGKRFKELAPTSIARMYHSCSALLPDTKVLVAGSNMHQFYTLDCEYPTELRVERFSPPYTDPVLDNERPVINPEATDKVLKYGKPFQVTITSPPSVLGEIKITLLYPPFTTHGFSQNQRMLVPAITTIENNVITAVAPGSGMLAPPGYYILFVSRLGAPGAGVWVHID